MLIDMFDFQRVLYNINMCGLVDRQQFTDIISIDLPNAFFSRYINVIQT